ncbi:MAG: 50S ribosome-binding GTPase [Candidatus Freyarchaeota archaeon]|nr:50S ribosome-binding GTPase [Candidatus Jordarchaeia archaeon]
MKVLVAGGYHSGKSSVVRFLSGGGSIHIDKHGTTVALDYGRVDVEGLRIHLFGTPGMRHFRILREILSRGADGVFFVIDSADPGRDDEANAVKREIDEFLPDVVRVYLANKQDVNGARPPEVVRQVFKIPDDVPVIGTSTVTGLNLSLALRMLVAKLIEKASPLLNVLKKHDGEAGGISRFADAMEFNLASTRKVLNWLELRGYIEVDWRAGIFWLTSPIKNVLEKSDELSKGN